MSYRPKPSREVLIPKNDGKVRPLGISSIEDKIVELMFKKILEAIYEPLFYNFSYGFRPGRSCHQAVAKLQRILFSKYDWTIIDLDLENFFGSIDHNKLCALIGLKVKDRRFLRYIKRLLKTEILTADGLKPRSMGTVQGSICSPILANIFAHFALDDWIERQVKPVLNAQIQVVRYADDLCICVSNASEAYRLLRVIPNRLKRFGLKMHSQKTKIIRWDRIAGKGGVFNFLGFTFHLGLSKKGMAIPKVKTAGERMCKSLNEITEWIKKFRNVDRLSALWKYFQAKMRGHIQYFAVSFNLPRVKVFLNKATEIFFKWINRRSQKRSFTWEKFKLFMQKYPLPKLQVKTNLLTIRV